jgi:CHAD domain-containing protein
MPRTDQSAHPIQILREGIQNLEAAILICLGNPNKKAVHTLRTSTRRVEAQLQLLTMLPDLPPHQKQSRKATRLLKKLRRAAGKVRDLDVQRGLIGNEAAGNNGGSRPSPEVRKQAHELRLTLKRKREDAAENLLQLLQEHRSEFPLVFEKLLDVLSRAESISLTEAHLTALVREWYAQHTPASAPQDPAQLHDIRKRAKLARYLAESAPESAAAAHRLAAHFEALQQAGGEWHDWLLLHQLSASELGKSAQLPQRFSAHADSSLRAYKRRLTTHNARSTSHAKAA